MATRRPSAQLAEQLPIRTKGNSKCPNHRQKDIIFLCVDCDEEMICATCSITTHKSHELVELSSVKTQHNSKLQHFINTTENNALPQLKMEIQLTQKELKENSQYFSGLRAKVTEYGQKCKQEIDDFIQENKATCDKMELRNQNLLKDHIKELQKRITSLERFLNECKQTLQNGTTVQAHDVVLDIQKLDSKIPDLPKQQWPKFHPSQDMFDQLKKAIGSLSTDHKVKIIKIKLLREPVVQSQCKFRHHITSIRPTKGNRAWVCNFESNILELIDLKWQTQKKIKNEDKIRDISISRKTGHVWFCCKEAKTVCEVSSSSKIPVIKFRTDETPYSICVTKSELVVLGSENKVSIYTQNGHMLHSSSHQMSGISSAGEITQCPVTGNIAVLSAEILKGSDKDNWKGKIIIYDEKLKVKSYYSGGERRADTFGPGSVAYDLNGNLVVADMKQHSVELISGLGHHIKTLSSTKGQGVIGLEEGQILWTTSEPSPGKWEVQLLKYF
ncbi:uncharacterized protein [Argopecten irradians]|uniref:uncharacterized protein n=1 Tax=Argopecten irradians TaxID=31199 RepID=UPI00371141F9